MSVYLHPPRYTNKQTKLESTDSIHRSTAPHRALQNLIGDPSPSSAGDLRASSVTKPNESPPVRISKRKKRW
ncbi:hypothetical protein P154DRAFT_523558 [Amniculicola lignicola CBS 123094]|uniref:Uncharacterized protein n=1 Tax=Amniculicola lignicola CBS 123094 TaxID=1392246 RepID=A0A6A5WB85_9PLEO|nr:hypothetical protein P154DRAFT_523558 [Amniculicola lignicola CBS 123094]